MPAVPTSSRDGSATSPAANARGAAILRRKSHDMKLHRESIAAAIVLFALVGDTGCKKKDADESATTAATEAATAQVTAAVTATPTAVAATAAADVAAADTAAEAPPPADAPEAPADKVEVKPAAPSADHVWVPGLYVGAATSAPPPIRVEVIGRAPSARHVWVKGHWQWNGTTWLWIG